MRVQTGERSATWRCRRMLAAAVACAAGICATSTVWAQSAGYPQKPVRVFVPYGPGGVGDLTMRLLAVPDKSPYRSLKDLVDAAQKGPGKINLGAINPGSTQNLSAHLFQQVTGAQYTVIPFRTTPDLVTALLRGDVDLGFDYYAALQGVIGPDKIRIIATSGERRNPLLKDVPTARESGFPDYIVTSWNGLGAPAKVPAEIVTILNAAVNKALSDPELKAKTLSLGMEASGSTPQQMHDRLAADAAKWREVIEKAGIPKE